MNHFQEKFIFPGDLHMFNKNVLTRSILSLLLVASSDLSARDGTYGAAGAVDQKSYDYRDNAGLESIPSEIIRAMMRAEALSDDE